MKFTVTWKFYGMLAIASFLIVGCATSDPTNVVSPAPATPSPEVVSQSTPAISAPSALKSGTFVAGEHPTTGTVQIISEGGQQFVDLGENFQTSEMGPDLVVILHRDADILGSTRPPAYPLTEGSYVVLAPLEEFQGAQRYAIPATLNISEYASVAIWCRKFNATFGAASLR